MPNFPKDFILIATVIISIITAPVEKRNLLDSIIEIVSPGTALKRHQQRVKLDMLNDVNKEWKSHKRRYDAASISRHTSDWYAPNQSANQEVLQAYRLLRDRSRDLARNNPYARHALRLLANNVAGTGILPTPKNVLANQSKALKLAWSAWGEKTICDFDNNYNFYGLQWLAMRTIAESGEVLIRRVRATSNYAVPLRLQILESDLIDSSHSTGWEKDINGLDYIEFYGIRFNKQGERLGYWIWEQHPAEWASKSNFVSAEDIIHLYEVERPGQIRGVPILSSVMLRLRDLDDYEFTERLRNKVAACFTAFVQDSTPVDSQSSDTYDTEKLEPGGIEYLPPGKTIAFAQPPSKDGFGEYTKANLRGIATGIGATYENLAADYSNVNFSSGKLGWNEFAHEIEQWQWNILIPKLCDRVYNWFVESCQIAGVIPFNKSVQVSWTPPKREMIDPLKETQATRELLRAGLTSWQREVKKNGDLPDELREELLQDKKMWDSLVLMPTADPRFDPNRSTGEAMKGRHNRKRGKR